MQLVASLPYFLHHHLFLIFYSIFSNTDLLFIHSIFSSRILSRWNWIRNLILLSAGSCFLGLCALRSFILSWTGYRCILRFRSCLCFGSLCLWGFGKLGRKILMSFIYQGWGQVEKQSRNLHRDQKRKSRFDNDKEMP